MEQNFIQAFRYQSYRVLWKARYTQHINDFSVLGPFQTQNLNFNLSKL